METSLLPDSPWHAGDLCCPCDFLSLFCSSIVQLCTKCTWPTPQADGSFFPYLDVSTFGVSGGQEGPGDDQLLLLLHNLFKRFIYNRCDRWANKRSIDGDWICLSTYQPREGGGWHRLRRHRGQLRRHQCVSLVSGWKPSISIPALWQGARGPGGRVQVCQPLLLPLWLRKLDSSWPQEARRTQLPQGLEGGWKGEIFHSV